MSRKSSEDKFVSMPLPDFVKYINSEVKIQDLKPLYEKYKNLLTPEKIEVLETALYECFARDELPERYARRLLEGSCFFGLVAKVMPNKKYRYVIIRARFMGRTIELKDYVFLRSPKQGRYQVGSCIYLRITKEGENFYHEAELEPCVDSSNFFGLV